MLRCISQHKVWNYYQENSKKMFMAMYIYIYIHKYVQVPDLAHARTTQQLIRRTAHLSLKNRNESRLTTMTNQTTICANDERSLLVRAIARATDSWEASVNEKSSFSTRNRFSRASCIKHSRSWIVVLRIVFVLWENFHECEILRFKWRAWSKNRSKNHFVCKKIYTTRNSRICEIKY